MAQTILDVLVKPNPDISSRSVTGGSDSVNNQWIPIANWQRWEDFTYENVMSTCKKALLARWEAPPHIDRASEHDFEIRDEHSLDLFLARFMVSRCKRSPCTCQ